jgi:ribosomal protein S18 acetylase RimI-like enzyme
MWLPSIDTSRLQRVAVAEPGPPMRIETVTAATFEQVLPLIADYQRFYRATPDEARNRAHFGRLLTDHAHGIQFIALADDGRALGFATLYFPLSSVSAQVRCLMNDLYTVPDARGQGIGRALIRHCAAYARDHGYSSIFWQTEQTNTTAQRLYDSLSSDRTAWYTYTLPADEG